MVLSENGDMECEKKEEEDVDVSALRKAVTS